MEPCQIVAKLLPTHLDGHWRIFGLPTTGEREIYQLAPSVYIAGNRVGVPNVLQDGNVNGVDLR